ncbi:hypothetical protein C8J57DRAFT_1312051 [Mycena rebaudengoi]|nr:hypothetical protein C8J57DRAFT_1312051 [Mycena rebaudengoi]
MVDMLEDSSTTELCNQAIFEILFQLTLHESTAVAVVEANMLHYFGKRLRSPTATQRPEICWILRNLMSHSSTAAAVLDMGLYDALATLWREDPDGRRPTLTFSIISLLTRMASSREGATAVGVEIAKLLNNVGLHSVNEQLRLHTCRLLRVLIGHEEIVETVVAIVPRGDIVALLSDWENAPDECAQILEILGTRLGRIDDNFRSQ